MKLIDFFFSTKGKEKKNNTLAINLSIGPEKTGDFF